MGRKGAAGEWHLTPSETAVSADKTAPEDSSVTELPLNIDVLRRYHASKDRKSPAASENSLVKAQIKLSRVPRAACAPRLMTKPR